MEYKLKLFTFEDISNILTLDSTEQTTDELIFNSTYSIFEKYIGFNIEEKNYNEIQTVRDNKVLINEINITEMIQIVDMNTKEKIANCVIDSKNKTVFLLSYNYEGHVLFLNYNAGFTKETFPEDLKEAITKLFILKKTDYITKQNQTENANKMEEAIPNDIKDIFDMYSKKRL